MTQQPPFSTTQQVNANLIITVAMMFFSLGLPLTEELAKRYSVMSLVVIRNILAGLFLLGLSLVLERGRFLSRSGIRHAVFSGSTFYILSIICLFYGVTMAGAFPAAIILSTVPVVSAILDVIEGYGRVGPRLVLSIMLSLFGGVLASLDMNSGSMQMSFSFGLGEFLLIVGVYAWVVLSRYVNTHMTEEPRLSGIGLVILAPGLLLMPIVIGMDIAGVETTRLVRPDGWGMPASDILLVLLLGFVASAGSMILWFKGSAVLGTTISGLQQNLVPFFVLLQVWWLGQIPHLIQILGGVFVILGAIVAQIRELRPRAFTPSSG